ncbi:Hypothetical predicted protein [Lecanosticta acicola]|uniref:F-box domain-containing protein n=1 Tax=Lecanosticta acicola TaxID=111012 RepID=A0AAI9EAF9_9PEZI|nr:Hypothetical predicted protein [Lecanosticta acicola]
MLSELPVELLDLTFSFLDQDDTATWTALCTTSKLCQKLATAYLYGKVNLSSSNDGLKGWAEHSELLAERVQLICRTFVENMALAKLVETLVWPHLDDYYVETNSSKEFQTLLIDDLKQRGLPRDFARTLARYDTRSTLAVVVIHLCSEINTLELTGVDGNTVDNLQLYMGQDSPDFHVGLKQVSHVRLHLYYGSSGRKTDNFDFFLRLPALQSMVVSNVPRLNYVVRDIPFFDSSIKYLELTHFKAHSDDLERLLRHCVNLEILRIQFTGDRFHRRLDYGGSGGIGNILRDNTQQLQHLELDYEWEEPYPLSPMDLATNEHNPDYPLSGLGDLSPLKSLRRFRLAKSALLGTHHQDSLEDEVGANHPITLENAFPDSIEEVEIICPEKQFSADDMSLFQTPGVERLRNLTIFNCTKDRWASKKYGEGCASEQQS